jgi:Tol biopolymer transport system component
MRTPLPEAGWHLGLPRIYLADRESDELTPLSFGTQPAWSPTGQQVAFVRNRGPIIQHAPARYEIFLVGTDGANAVSLVEGVEPAWSPDGTQLVFTSVDGISRMDVVEGPIPVLLVSHDTPGMGWNWFGPDPNDRVSSPSWSPEAQHIAFQFRGSTPGNSASKVYITEANGSGLRRLTESDESHHEVQPTWSPDGSAVGYIGIGPLAPDGSLVKVDRDGKVSDILHIADNPEAAINYESEIAWSPDGSTIAFTAGISGQSGIWGVDPGTGTVALLFPNAFDPTWGPDGRIAFASWEYCANEWVVSIWVGGPGQTPTNLYHGPTPASSLDVRVGGTVTWVSRNQRPPFTSHLVSTSHPPGGQPFDSSLMEAGDSFSFIPGVEGTWAYVDQITGVTGTFTASLGTSLPGLNCSAPGDIK